MHLSLKHGPQDQNDYHCRMDQKLDARSQYTRDRDGQSREIDLAEHLRIGQEGRGVLVQAVGKEYPQRVAAQIEEELRDPVGAELGNVSEYYRINNARQKRADDYPQRTEYGLLVHQLERSLREQNNKVPVSPHLFEVHAHRALFSGYMNVIRHLIILHFLHSGISE